jgi:hypothetical protein
MTEKIRPRKRTVLIGTCWFTALLNAVFSPGYAQEDPQETPPAEGAATERILRYGIFDVRPSLQGGVRYDDNIYTQSSDLANEVEDVIWSVIPGITLGAGGYLDNEGNLLLLTYAPTINFFTHNSRENSVDHDAKVAGQYRSGPWTLGLQQTYQQFHDNVVDVGTRVERDFWITSAFAKYELSPKTLLDFFGNASFNDYEGTTTTSELCYNEYSGGVGLDYAITPKMKLGPAIKAGLVDQKMGGDQNYQQGLVRANYYATEKVSFRATAGVELRNFQGANAADSEINPVFELGMSYKPLEFTVITLDAYRREQPSVSAPSANYETLGGALGVSQTFREFYIVGVRAGYQHLNYVDRIGGAATDREDDYIFGRLTFDYQPWDDLTVGVFYEYRQNDSDDPTFEFDNNQFGLSFAYRF